MLSSFYTWLARQPEFATLPNPVHLARPKAPKLYQSKRTKALSDAEVRALCQVIRASASAERAEERRSALRDYALLWLLMLTGLRRREVVQLRREHLWTEGATVIVSTLEIPDTSV